MNTRPIRMVTTPPMRCSSSRFTLTELATPNTVALARTNTTVKPSTKSMAAPATRKRPLRAFPDRHGRRLRADQPGQVRQIPGDQRHNTGRRERHQAGDHARADRQDQRPSRNRVREGCADRREIRGHRGTPDGELTAPAAVDAVDAVDSATKRSSTGSRSMVVTARRNTAAARCCRSITSVVGTTEIAHARSP